MVLKTPKLTPAILMLFLAIFIDAIPIVLEIFGLTDLGLCDILGSIFIDGWLFIRGNKTSISNKKNGFLRKIFTGKYSKFLVPTIIEAIPYIDVLPTWTISVWINLTETSEDQTVSAREPENLPQEEVYSEPGVEVPAGTINSPQA